MKCFPIIPLWIVIPISIIFIVYSIFSKKIDFISITIIILLFIINLRIMIPNNNIDNDLNNLNVLFVFDNTISMQALDYDGKNTRMSGVVEDSTHIINKLYGANFSLISFDNNTKVVIPYTRDVNSIINGFNNIMPIDDLYAKGSSLNIPYNTIIDYLKKSKEKNNTNILFFISDGEITNNDKLRNYHDVGGFIDDGAVLGYGSNKGGYMMSTTDSSDNKYIIDNSNHDKAISRIEENNLKRLANDLNIDYIHMNKKNNIDDKLSEIKYKNNKRVLSSNMNDYNDIYYIFVVPLLILLLIDFERIRRMLIWENYYISYFA